MLDILGYKVEFRKKKKTIGEWEKTTKKEDFRNEQPCVIPSSMVMFSADSL